jgi:hypothetical protein
LAFLAALIVAFAEIWLYIAQAKRVERAREVAERLGEGDKAEMKTVIEGGEAENSIDRLVPEVTDRTTKEVSSEEILMEQTEGVTQTSRELANVRLRRRPVAGQD